MSAQAAIVAGGLGTRMRAFSDKPKAMLDIAGKPLLERQLEWLKAAGVTEIFLCLGYKADVVRAYFGDGRRWGLKLDYRVETAPRGTAGAVRDIKESVRGDLLVVYGDIHVAMDCGKLLDFHRARADAAATLVVCATDHPFDSDLVKADGDKITGFFRPKPGDSFENLAAAAVWVVRPALLEKVPAGAPSDFGRDVFPQAVARGETLLAYRTDEALDDVGTPERLEGFLRRWKEKVRP